MILGMKNDISSVETGGGSVMVWAGFSQNGKTSLAFLNGKIEAEDYQLMLVDNLLPYTLLIAGIHWVFQQGNAAIHSAKCTIEWLECWHVNVIKWLAYNPDLNPIENCRCEMIQIIYHGEHQYQNLHGLKKAILSAWNQLSLEQ